MAGKKINISCLRASSILEVVISMVIIVVVFGIAMMIYINVSRTSNSPLEIHAKAVLQGQFSLIEKSGDFTDASFQKDSLTIERKVKDYDEGAELVEIDLTAYDQNGKLLAEARKVVINDNE